MTETLNTADEMDELALTRACFPARFLIDFLEYLHARRGLIEVITYADLPWEDDYNVENNYLAEFTRWREQIRSGRRDPNKIYVILQHDVDACPERMHAILRHEHRVGIRSNIMIFNRRLNRKRLQTTGQLEDRGYDVDHRDLQRLEKLGFVIGYHSNAYEWSQFDPALAREIFERDVAELRRRYKIDFFCPHGGVRDGNGRSNAVLEIPPSLERSIRWVLNRHTVRFDGVYSDGAINSPNRSPEKRDLRAFVASWKPGKRYRILTHPQHYDEAFTRSERLSGTGWYEEIVAHYERESPGSIWEKPLPRAASAPVAPETVRDA